MGTVHRPDPGWASHIPVLIKALEISEGSVLEVGMGYFSTPLLHALCAQQNRYLCSIDYDKYYVDLFSKFHDEGAPGRYGHNIMHLDDWWEKAGESVVFIDSKPAERRKDDIKKVVDCDYVIIHDSEDPLYGYDEIYPLFKYRYDYKKFPTWTTVLSNKHELHQFHNTLG